MRLIVWLTLTLFLFNSTAKAQNKVLLKNKNYQLGQFYLNEKLQYDSAYYFLNKAVTEIEQTNDSPTLALLLNEFIEFQKNRYFELADATPHLNKLKKTLTQCCPDSSSIQINYYLNKGLHEIQFNQNDYQVYHDSAMAIIQQHFPENHILYSKYYFSQYYCLAQKGQYREAIEKLKQAQKIAVKNENSSLKLLSSIYFELGLIKRIYRELDEAIDYYQKALEVSKKLGISAATGGIYIELAYLFSRQGNFKTAEKYYIEGLAIYEKHLNKSHHEISYCACHLGELHTTTGAYQKAQILLEKRAKIEEENFLNGSADIRAIYKCLGNLVEYYRISGQTENAINTNLKLINFIEQKKDSYGTFIYVPLVYLKLAKAYRSNKQYELAYQSALKALKAKKEAYPKTPSRYFDIYNELAIITLNGQLPHNPISYIDSAIYVLKDKTELITNKALVLKTKSDILFKQKAYQDVIALSDSILSMLNKQEKATSFKEIARPELYLSVMEQKAKSLFKITENNQLIAKKTLTEFQQLYQNTNQYLQYLSNENSISNYAASIDTLFNPAINLAAQSYSKNADKKLFYTALQFAEAHKSLSLQTRINSLKSRTEIRIPKELIEREKELKDRIGYLKNQIYQTRQKGGMGSKKNIALFKEKLQQADFDFMAFSDSIYLQYPHYYQLNYDYRIPLLSKIKNELLQDNQALLSYKIIDNTIYGLSISKQYQQLIAVDAPQNLTNLVSQLLQNIANNNNEWTDLSHQLYQLLIANFNLPQNINSFIIIPDGVLNYLPFEMLLQQPINKTNPNQWQFIIKDYEIAYAYSIKHLWDSKSIKPKKFDNHLVAFAPDYNNFEIDQNLLNKQEDEQLLAILRDGSNALPFATKEVNEISNLYNGKTFSGNSANKNNFQNYANKSAILHLAMHAIVDNNDPLYSKLLFAPQNNTDANHYLNTYELLNMDVKAEMTVLSACNTGFGQLKAGEGVMSLSRAFAYAGCPSTIMSLWKVPDNSTYQIMIKFYQELQLGKTKSQALRQAKLHYLQTIESKEMANPLWWAGFVAVGNMQAIQINKSWNWLWLLLVLPLVLPFRLIIKKRKL